MADDVGQILITGVHCHHFIETKQRESRYNGLSEPTLVCFFAVKTFNQQSVFPESFFQFYGRDIEASQLGKAHGDEFRLDDTVKVGTC